MQPVIEEAIQFHSLSQTLQSQNDAVKVQGRWNHQEHLKFLNAIIRYGKDWKKVQDEVSTRTGAQVRSHAQKYFLKITKIIKDRKKIKGKKMPEITDTELQLKQYFANYPLAANTPKQIIDLLRIEKVGIKNVIEENCNGNQKINIQQLLAPTVKLQKKKLQKPEIKQFSQRISQTIQNEVNQVQEDSSFLTALIGKYKQYFFNGGQISAFIDYGTQMKKEKMIIQEQETSGQRKHSFCQFDEEHPKQ